MWPLPDITISEAFEWQIRMDNRQNFYLLTIKKSYILLPLFYNFHLAFKLP